MPSSSKTDLTIIVNMCRFNSLFNGKLSSVLNLIFMKCLSYLQSRSFMFSILFLIPSQSSLYFLILLCFHPNNQKLNIYFHFFSSICPITSPIIRYKGFKLIIFSQLSIFLILIYPML